MASSGQWGWLGGAASSRENLKITSPFILRSQRQYHSPDTVAPSDKREVPINSTSMDTADVVKNFLENIFSLSFQYFKFPLIKLLQSCLHCRDIASKFCRPLLYFKSAPPIHGTSILVHTTRPLYCRTAETSVVWVNTMKIFIFTLYLSLSNRPGQIRTERRKNWRGARGKGYIDSALSLLGAV